MSRRKARECALQMLFQKDIAQSQAEEVHELFWKSSSATDETRQFAQFLFFNTLENTSLIEDLIQRYAQHWRLERMAAVDRNILRMAIAEFLTAETPKAVVIDEAIEIARKYGSDRSPEFVNGILDSIKQELEGTRP